VFLQEVLYRAGIWLPGFSLDLSSWIGRAAYFLQITPSKQHNGESFTSHGASIIFQPGHRLRGNDHENVRHWHRFIRGLRDHTAGLGLGFTNGHEYLAG
jgi:hypothetical protein